MQYPNTHVPCSHKSAIGNGVTQAAGLADMDWSYNGPRFRRKTSVELIFTTLQGSGDYYCTRRNTIQVAQMVKSFSLACPYHTHLLLYSMLSQSFDNTVPLHEWWAVFTVCSMCVRRQQHLLFCLFVADRAWVLLAVRPSIHKAILSLIDGDPLNYRLKQERRLQKTTLVKVSYDPLIFQNCVCVHEEKRERMSRRSQMHFSLFRFFFSFGCLSLVRPCLVLLLSWGVISV